MGIQLNVFNVLDQISQKRQYVAIVKNQDRKAINPILAMFDITATGANSRPKSISEPIITIAGRDTAMYVFNENQLPQQTKSLAFVCFWNGKKVSNQVNLKRAQF